MSRYVDGYVIPMKKKDVTTYKKMATMGKKMWMKRGALDYYECVGDEINVPFGMPFNKLCKLKSNETVIFAFIVYKSKAHREKVNKQVHADMEEFIMPESYKKIMNMKRFTMGGFKVLVNS